jgi:chromatin segregation and condensation protein Rec8/ScpA/Scc1 (kleisin family)
MSIDMGQADKTLRQQETETDDGVFDRHRERMVRVRQEMDKYEELIAFLNQRFRLFDPKFDAGKFVPPRVLERADEFMRIAGMFPSDEEIKAELLQGEKK